MARKGRRSVPALVPGYERMQGPLRHYRVIETGEEISRRQYQQRARGYVYEKVAKGRARAKARSAYEGGWVEFLRSRFDAFATRSKTAILTEMRRLGFLFPHHGARRKPSPGERARQEAFMGFIGRSETSYRQVYPSLIDAAEP